MKHNTNKTFLVAKREYIKTVRSKTFWFSIIALPIFVLVISFVSGYSSASLEDKITQQANDGTSIHIVDEVGVIDPTIFQGDSFVQQEDAAALIEMVKSNEVEAAIVYPADLVENAQIQIYAQDKGIIQQGRYNELAKSLVRNSAITAIEDPVTQALVTANFSATTTSYLDGEVVEHSIEKYIVPAGFIVVYFLIFILVSNFLLASISEEKENRMIEIILSSITPRSFIWGKIFGFTLIVVTQIVVLVSLSLAAVYAASLVYELPIDLSALTFDFWQIAIAFYFVFTGFLFFASIMVGVGSAMPTYKEAGQLAPVFIIASISPLYIVTALIAEPSGTLAQVLSYIPFTAPIVMLFRNALDALEVWELAISAAIMAVSVVASFILAFKIFEIGSLEYSNKISLKRLFKKN